MSDLKNNNSKNLSNIQEKQDDNVINSNLYHQCVLTERMIIEAKFLNENLENYIFQNLTKRVEGKCINEGYVMKNSVSILKKSIGKITGSRFTGDITYDVAFTANVCNPEPASVIDCQVKGINKLGLKGKNGPMSIVVPKQFHSDLESFHKISVNDIVKVEVICKNVVLNESEIKVVGRLWSENNNNNGKKLVQKREFTSQVADISQSADGLEDIENEVYVDEGETFMNQTETMEGEDDEDSIDLETDDFSEEDEDYEDDEDVKNISMKVKDEDNILEADDIEMDDDDDDDDDYDDEEGGDD